MTDKVTVWPKFFSHSIDVDPDEAQSLERGGLLRDGPVGQTPAAAVTVTVVPVFTGRPMEMSPLEAASLDQAGLLVHEQAQEPEQQQQDQAAGQSGPGSEQETE